MYNAAIKTAIIAAATSILVACNSESPQARAARELYEQAQASLAAGDARIALEALDSLQAAYPTVTDWQRKGMKLRPQAMKQAAEQRITIINDSVALLEEQLQDQQASLRKIDDPRLVEPYYVDKATYKADFLNTTGVQPRISDIGQFYLISSINPGNNRHTGITFTAADGRQATAGPVPYDADLNYRINGSEVVTYSPEQSNPIGLLAAQAPGAGKITFTGGTPRTIQLTAAQVQGIATCYEASVMQTTLLRLTVDRDRQQHIIAIAQSQSSRMTE